MSGGPTTGRDRAASARLLEMAGPDVFRRNPFRVTGLATDAPARLVRQQRQRALAKLSVGAAAPSDETRLPLPAPPSADEVRAAFDELDNIERRLVFELFWWWGEPGRCGCPAELHRLHDAAVEAYARVLDEEAAGTATGEHREQLWSEAADTWSTALDAAGFWDHVRHRVTGLADRRLDESTVDGLADAMPAALLGPQVAVAAAGSGVSEVADLLEEWTFPDEVVDDARDRAAAPVYDRVTGLLDELGRELDKDNGAQVASRARDELIPAARELEDFVPHEFFRRSAGLRNRAAVVLNNCATRLMDEPGTPANRALITALLNEAKDIVVDKDTRSTVEGNIAAHQQSATFTPSFRPGGAVAPSWQQADELIKQNRTLEAIATLNRIRKTSTDRVDRAQATELIKRLRRLTLTQAPEQTRIAGAGASGALLLAFFDICTYIGVEQGLTPLALALLLTVGGLLPKTLVASRGFISGPMQASAGFPGFLLLLGLAGTIALMVGYGFFPIAICLGIWLLSQPFARRIALRVLDAREGP